MIEKLYTVEEVAELASVTGRTIRNYLKSGRLVGRKIGGQWRFPEAEVQRLLTGGAPVEEEDAEPSFDAADAPEETPAQTQASQSFAPPAPAAPPAAQAPPAQQPAPAESYDPPAEQPYREAPLYNNGNAAGNGAPVQNGGRHAEPAPLPPPRQPAYQPPSYEPPAEQRPVYAPQPERPAYTPETRPAPQPQYAPAPQAEPPAYESAYGQQQPPRYPAPQAPVQQAQPPVREPQSYAPPRPVIPGYQEAPRQYPEPQPQAPAYEAPPVYQPRVEQPAPQPQAAPQQPAYPASVPAPQAAQSMQPQAPGMAAPPQSVPPEPVYAPAPAPAPAPEPALPPQGAQPVASPYGAYAVPSPGTSYEPFTVQAYPLTRTGPIPQLFQGPDGTFYVMQPGGIKNPIASSVKMPENTPEKPAINPEPTPPPPVAEPAPAAPAAPPVTPAAPAPQPAAPAPAAPEKIEEKTQIKSPENTEPKAEAPQLSEVGQRVTKFIAEVHDCSRGPIMCTIIELHQSLKSAKLTSDRLADIADQESEEGQQLCQCFVEFDDRFYVARYTLFGTTAFLMRCLKLLG